MEDDTYAQSAKLVISAGLTLAVALIPGVGDAIESVGGQTEVSAIVLGTWGLIHGLVHYVHTRTRRK